MLEPWLISVSTAQMLEVIPVQSADPFASYIMIELQGEICNCSDRSSVVQQIGTICQQKPDARAVHLTIGHHQLSGRLVDLKKPLLVLQKGPQTSLCYQVAGWTENSCLLGWSCYKLPSLARNPGCLQAVGLIHKKYHFKSRPQAIISKPGSM